jgi:antitoxin component YwqK of YwqJK toxin-antitoxin module
MKRLLVLFAVALLVSCASREEVVEQTFPNGKPKIVMVYEGSDSQRLLVAQKSYYISGQAEVTGRFNEDGKRTGNWIYYYENGNKWSECEYITGVRNGNSITYYENGNKRYEGSYVDDKQLGHWSFYKEDGSIEREKNY